MDHDGGDPLLFSHPRMVADLLAGFVDEAWVAALDLATLERVNATFHADGLDRRDGDVIWTLKRHGGGEAYLDLAIEFQSCVDRWIALRLGVSVLLLSLHLIREGKVGPDGLLPPLYPIVLVNGDTPWSARADRRDLIAPGPQGRPWPWRPRRRDHSLDEQRDDARRLQGRDTLVAVLVQREPCRTVAELRMAVDRGLALLPEEENASLRRAFATVLKAVLAPARGIDLGAGDLSEVSQVRDRLANRVKEWQQEWLQQGIEKGLRQGRSEGRVEGQAEMLLRLLRRRFGAVPAAVSEWVRAGSPADLDAWSDRLLDAGSLEEVFADPPRS